jgi:hypothetical protein
MKTPQKPGETPSRGRRDFLKIGGAAFAANLASAARPASVHAESADHASAEFARAVQEMMPTRNLGQTGYRVGIFGLGGQGALEKANNEAIALPVIEKALELGVNYFDTSAIYGGPDRWSEQYLGKGLKGVPRSGLHRQQDEGAYSRCRAAKPGGIVKAAEHRSYRHLATS